MFIPLHDSNSLKRIKLQYVTIGLIIANVAAYSLTSVGGEHFATAAALGLGYIPSTLNNIAKRPSELILVPDYATLITYSFLHGDLMHLGGNMLFLWVFGDNVEDALGHWRFLVFYLLCAAAGAWMHGVLAPDSQTPLIGASGAIAGVVTAYLILHPRVKIWILAFARIPLRVPANIVLEQWIGLQFAMLLLAEKDQISWAAHVGGIIAGAILVVLMRRRDVPLLDREIVAPRGVEMRDRSAVQPTESAPAPRWGRQ
jgi:membrane associated rhomboid family serine protease